MMHDDMYARILTFLHQNYKKNPLAYVGCSTMRAYFDTPVYALRPYAETLELNGYVEKLEGMSPTYVVRITKKGIDAIERGHVDIHRDATVHTPLKLRILEYLSQCRESGKDTYYVRMRSISGALDIAESDVRAAVDELAYMGHVRKVGSVSGYSTVQITKLGLTHLARNSHGGLV